MPNYLLGMDVGTSGCKTVLLDSSGKMIASDTQFYPMSTPKPSWAEQDPSDWWAAAVKSIRGVMDAAQISSKDIAAIGLTGQMHGLVILDQHGEVIRPCIMWNDQRTVKQCRSVTEQLGLKAVIKHTGNQILPGFTAPKIKWVAENEPENFSRIAKILLPKDFIRYKLSGAFASEVSDASGTSLFDVKNRRWSPEMLDVFGVDRAWLPEVTESPVVSAHVSQEAAEVTGLVEGTPIVGGAGDQAAQAVGAGILAEGDASVTLGTSGVVFSASDSYKADPQGVLHAFCHAVTNKWHLMGVMLSAAGSLRWFRDAIAEMEIQQASELGVDPYEILTEKAARVPPGSEGLIFLPYLTGERTPYPNPNARGVYFGLSLRHEKAHLVRALLEGVAYGLRDSLELMKGLGLDLNAIRASGGGARSDLWLQILANVFSKEILRSSSDGGAALGAAMIAGVGVGAFKDFQAAYQKTMGEREKIAPNQDQQLYEDFYQLYRSLYEPLKPLFDLDQSLVSKYLGD